MSFARTLAAFRPALCVALVAGALGAWQGCGAPDAAPERAPAAERAASGDGDGGGDAAKPERGRWGRFRTHQFDADLDPAQREMVARLEALGYASGVEPPPAESGVTRYDAARAWPGLNLYSSAHRPEALLMDMDGNVLHRWHVPFEDVWPDYPGELPGAEPGRKRFDTYWRRIHLFPNGDLLAIFEGLGVLRIDKDSNVLWASPVRAHHDLDVAPDGTVYVLTREAHLVPRVNADEPILEDFISTLDERGEEVSRVSVLEAMEHSPYRRIWDRSGRRSGDLFHTNTLVWLDGRIADRVPAFRRGNFLVSMNWLNTIAVVDPEARRVVWAQTGPFFTQHDPKIVDDGNLLVFNNRLGPDRSAVWEIDPATHEITWRYEGGGEPFFSGTCGAAERLPNGDTLVTETDGGRAFEVTHDGEIVWEFYNPHRAGPQGEFIATIMEMIRLPLDFPIDWADGRPAG